MIFIILIRIIAMFIIITVIILKIIILTTIIIAPSIPTALPYPPSWRASSVQFQSLGDQRIDTISDNHMGNGQNKGVQSKPDVIFERNICFPYSKENIN